MIPLSQNLKEITRRLEATFAGRCVSAFIDLRGIDRAMVIASEALTALIPLLILVSTFAPADRRDVVSQSFIRKFHLTGSAAEAVTEVFARPAGGASVGALSVLILVFSGLSLARRMQRLYLDAWHLDPLSGVRGSFNTFLGLAALVIDIGLLALARSLVRALPFDWLFSLPISLVSGFLLWISIPWLLLDGRVQWRRLVPTGVIATICASVYSLVATVYMPEQMETYSERYGLFGVTLALVGWLLVVSLILVAATVVAAEFDRSQGVFPRWVQARLSPTKGDAG
ncbi:YhjD/YihY/BrkB family envelope integrity protein [Kribbella sp. NPDC026596]|uniref:YhjD/YihY/BrkB family envelope integrity protein n=1 Tax=Kribbella sp. NPDC026596 TaxID=3155122 RepID=UPI0033F4B03C